MASLLAAVAALVAAGIAFFQLRALRREQRLSRRPIVTLESKMEGFRTVSVRNVGDGPAFDCSLTFWFGETLAPKLDPKDALCTFTSKNILISGEERPASIESELRPRDFPEIESYTSCVLAWRASFSDFFGERFVQEGRMTIRGDDFLDFKAY